MPAATPARRRPAFRTVALLALLAAGTACDDIADARTLRDAASPDAQRPDSSDARVPDAATHDAAAPDAATTDAGFDRDGGTAPQPVVGEDFVDFGALRPERRVLHVALDVPRDAFSLVVTADPGLVPRRIALLELRGPSGDVLFDASADLPQPFAPASLQNAAEQLPYSWMLPSSPELALEPGRYQIAFYVAASSADDAGVHVDAVLARGNAEDPPQPLQLIVWSVPGAALDAQSAAADPQLQAALARMAELYGAAEIALAPIAYRDLDAPGADAFAQLDDDAKLALLLASLSEQADLVRGLDLVLVDELTAEPGKTVLAKVSGVPGPPAHPALARRGAVIIPLASLPVSAERAGALLAHECAHYLGLAHTSEYDGLRHDPIADTPECPAERASHVDGSGAPLISAEDCADLDGTNLLFYTPPQSALVQDQLSPGQAYVLARNPLLAATGATN